MEYNYIVNESDYLAHHGIKGQKWGIRRYQNLDGSLTSEGRNRYGVGDPRSAGKYSKDIKELLKTNSDGVPEELANEAKKVNGGVDIYKYGYNRNVNCAFCSMSYEARRRGIDVQAQASIDGVIVGNNLGYFKEMYSNYKPSMTKQEIKRSSGEMNKGMTSDEVDKMIADCVKEGKNSRGQIGVYWKSQHPNGWPMGGHALNYELKDGKFYIVDPQVGRVFSDQDAKDYLARACNVRRTRTDNLKMNEKLVRRKYAEDATGDYGGINKAHKAYEKWYRANSIAGLINGATIAIGGGATAATGYMPLLIAPAATIAANATTKIGKEITRDMASANYRKAYQELADKWAREGRDEWYTTETERINGLDSLGNERRLR